MRWHRFWSSFSYSCCRISCSFGVGDRRSSMEGRKPTTPWSIGRSFNNGCPGDCSSWLVHRSRWFQFQVRSWWWMFGLSRRWRVLRRSGSSVGTFQVHRRATGRFRIAAKIRHFVHHLPVHQLSDGDRFQHGHGQHRPTRSRSNGWSWSPLFGAVSALILTLLHAL